jgi:transposase-like protein
MARKHYSAEFKAKIALEAIRGLKTVNEIATESGLHPSQIALWKKQAVEALPDTFSTRRQQQDKGQAFPSSSPATTPTQPSPTASKAASSKPTSKSKSS